MEIHADEKYVLLSLNPSIYPLEVVYAASYIMMEKCYVVLDGDPKQELIVTIRPKNPELELEKIAREFNDELINYATHLEQSKKTASLRDAMVKRAFLTQNLE